MKIQTCTTLFFLVLISLISNAQVTPVISNSNNKYNIYETAIYNQNIETIRNQYNINKKLSNYNTTVKYKLNNGFTENFFISTLIPDHYDTLNNKSTREGLFKIRYIIDEVGNVISCSLYFPKQLLILSNSEIEAILTEAMTHKFEYFKKPSDLNSFYFLFDISLSI